MAIFQGEIVDNNTANRAKIFLIIFLIHITYPDHMLVSVFLTEATQAVIKIMAQPEIICGENLSCNLSGTTEIGLGIFHIFGSHLSRKASESLWLGGGKDLCV